MPIYEWHCARCDRTFEKIVPAADGARRQRCPECGRGAPRVMSLAVLGGRAAAPAEIGSGPNDVTKLRVPEPARLCWMDDRSAARLAAYKQGRAREYEDVTAARAEARKQQAPDKPAAKKHGAHGPGHSHSESPLADPGVFARRAAAARKSADRATRGSRAPVPSGRSET